MVTQEQATTISAEAEKLSLRCKWRFHKDRAEWTYVYVVPKKPWFNIVLGRIVKPDPLMNNFAWYTYGCCHFGELWDNNACDGLTQNWTDALRYVQLGWN